MREKLIKDEITRRDNKKQWKPGNPTLTTLSANPTGGIRIKTWLLAILGFLLASLIVINTFITGQFNVTHFMNTTPVLDNYINNEMPRLSMTIKKSGFLVNNKGCRMVALDPNDSFSKQFMRKEKPIECEFGSKLPLVDSNETHLFINNGAVDQYYNSSEMPNCCWREVKRKENDDNHVDVVEACHPFQISTQPVTEFVKVECYRSVTQIYRDYHFFVLRKPDVEERCSAVQKAKFKKYSTKSLNHKLSVLVLGLDSISRLNFHRQMPRTSGFLRQMGAVEMLGYNKVGDNTYPNLVPVLTGFSDNELQLHCWNDTSKPFDSCPFIWKNYSAAGYRTVFAEDACAMTTFNYLKPGFKNPPTDYYLRPYCIATENDIGNTHKLNAHLCVGTRKTFENLLGYTKKIVKSFNSDPYFAFFWEASLTHDFFNYPSLGDDTYIKTIKKFYKDGLMNNTALIVMSDHGMRWGDFRQTYQGRIEGSLPFVFLILPKWWRKKYSMAFANLKRNAASLTTPYDLYETLLDLLDPEATEEDAIRRRTKVINTVEDEKLLPRGISWFLPIPDYRTCDLAGIPGHWCMCHKSNNISTDDIDVRNATGYLIEELNSMLNKYPQCAELTLSSINDAKVWDQTEEKDQKSPWLDYTVTIETIPGNAIFEASIRHNGDGTNKLVGSVSRLNAYGKQSACVDDFHMRLYCYCQ